MTYCYDPWKDQSSAEKVQGSQLLQHSLYSISPQAFRFSDHRMQQTAGHGLWLSFLQGLVLLNGCLHSVLLISWDHADAGLHGSHWATTAWEEGLHGGRGLHKSVADSSFLCPNCAQLSSKGINDHLVFTANYYCFCVSTTLHYHIVDCSPANQNHGKATP